VGGLRNACDREQSDTVDCTASGPEKRCCKWFRKQQGLENSRGSYEPKWWSSILPPLKPNHLNHMNLASAREQFELASLNLRTRASLIADEQTLALWRSYHDAERQLLEFERMEAALNGAQHAIEWQVEGEWPRMAQDAVLMTGSFASILTFDGELGTIQVTFPYPDAVCFSCVSDEVITGHPLYGKGLRSYGLFTVVNSTWIDELRKCDAVHPQFNEARWKAATHYLLCFKDRMCEVVTASKPNWQSFATKAEAMRALLSLCGIEASTPDSSPQAPHG
jgi:hypothetical protein